MSPVSTQEPTTPARPPSMPVEDAMLSEIDVEVVVRDGEVLRGNVFRPRGIAEPVPVILTVGPYGKDIPFEHFNKRAYELIEDRGPLVNWETPTPDWWVPHGYAVVRVDQRGTGRSSGQMNLLSVQETRDFYDVIEWAAAQPWSNGKVGLLGVSYYAIGQWRVAALRPPSLAAIIPWEGASDLYREWAYHAGMPNDWWMTAWFNRQVVPNQSANPRADQVLHGNVDHLAEVAAHPFEDEYFTSRSPRLEDIEVPLLSAGNWGGAGLHLRGNIEGYLRAGSRHKWLSLHTGNHTTPFYETRFKVLQLRFLDYWLKGLDNGLLDDPPVRVDVRRGSGTFERHESSWPLPGTDWQRWHLDSSSGSLRRYPASRDTSVSYQAPGGEVRFVSPAFDSEVEITGPVSARLFMSSDNTDMNVHVTLAELDEHGDEVLYDGSRYEPTSIAYGWLRASHRALDTDRSLPYRPFLRHDHPEPLTPGDIVQLDLEIWPTSVVLPRDHRLAVVVGAQDPSTSSFRHHNAPDLGGHDPFAGRQTLHSGPEHASYVLLPVIPVNRPGAAT